MFGWIFREWWWRGATKVRDQNLLCWWIWEVVFIGLREDHSISFACAACVGVSCHVSPLHLHTHASSFQPQNTHIFCHVFPFTFTHTWPPSFQPQINPFYAHALCFSSTLHVGLLPCFFALPLHLNTHMFFASFQPQNTHMLHHFTTNTHHNFCHAVCSHVCAATFFSLPCVCYNKGFI